MLTWKLVMKSADVTSNNLFAEVSLLCSLQVQKCSIPASRQPSSRGPTQSSTSGQGVAMACNTHVDVEKAEVKAWEAFKEKEARDGK
jgi:hypothetical protein